MKDRQRFHKMYVSSAIDKQLSAAHRKWVQDRYAAEEKKGERPKLVTNYENPMLKELALLLQTHNFDPQVANIILGDFKTCKIEQASSVPKNMQGQRGDETRAEELADIDLLTHTLNVVKQASIATEAGAEFRPHIIFLALIHDAGKSACIKRNYGIPECKKHEAASIMYAGNILPKNSVFRTVLASFKDHYIDKTHGAEDTNHFVKMLQKVDARARTLELAALREKQAKKAKVDNKNTDQKRKKVGYSKHTDANIGPAKKEKNKRIRGQGGD